MSASAPEFFAASIAPAILRLRRPIDRKLDPALAGQFLKRLQALGLQCADRPTTALPRIVTNSRRLIASPKAEDWALSSAI